MLLDRDYVLVVACRIFLRKTYNELFLKWQIERYCDTNGFVRRMMVLEMTSTSIYTLMILFLLCCCFRFFYCCCFFFLWNDFPPVLPKPNTLTLFVLLFFIEHFYWPLTSGGDANGSYRRCRAGRNRFPISLAARWATPAGPARAALSFRPRLRGGRETYKTENC